jgi:hypothetical protein
MRRITLQHLSFAFLLVATACSTTGTAPGGSEWKAGYIRRVVPGSQIKDVEVRPCVASLPSEQIASTQFLVVTYAKGRGWQYRTVRMPTDFAPEPGQRVWLNPRACVDAVRPY